MSLTQNHVELEEAQLVARVAAGDRGDPLVELYGRYGHPLYGLGLRLLGDRGSAEELVQETFLRLWRGSGSFDPQRGSVRSFIYTIAHRAAIDFRRRTSSRPLAALQAGEAGEERWAAGDSPEEPLETLIVGLEVREALEGLSSKHREVIDLGYREDLTQTQIAERLELPVGTVKTRTYHALRALRTTLEERRLLG